MMEMLALLMTFVPMECAREPLLLAAITTCVPQMLAILPLDALLLPIVCLAMMAMPALKWTFVLLENVWDLLPYSAITAILALLNSATLPLESVTQHSPLLSALITMLAHLPIAAPMVSVLVLLLSAMTRMPAQMILARLVVVCSPTTPTLAMMETLAQLMTSASMEDVKELP